YFSSIDSFENIAQLIKADVDGAAILAATRLAGAPDPAVVIDTPDCGEPGPHVPGETRGTRTISPAESRTFVSLAEKVAVAGNDVRAAIRYTQAARAAPGNRVAAARAAAETEIQRLV